MTGIRSVIRGTGGYLPERIMSNEEMSQIVETSDQWIQERTGIRQRHIAADDDSPVRNIGLFCQTGLSKNQTGQGRQRGEEPPSARSPIRRRSCRVIARSEMWN